MKRDLPVLKSGEDPGLSGKPKAMTRAPTRGRRVRVTEKERTKRQHQENQRSYHVGCEAGSRQRSGAKECR